jgi:hypothetical protein
MFLKEMVCMRNVLMAAVFVAAGLAATALPACAESDFSTSDYADIPLPPAPPKLAPGAASPTWSKVVKKDAVVAVPFCRSRSTGRVGLPSDYHAYDGATGRALLQRYGQRRLVAPEARGSSRQVGFYRRDGGRLRLVVGYDGVNRDAYGYGPTATFAIWCEEDGRPYWSKFPARTMARIEARRRNLVPSPVSP